MRWAEDKGKGENIELNQPWINNKASNITNKTGLDKCLYFAVHTEARFNELRRTHVDRHHHYHHHQHANRTYLERDFFNICLKYIPEKIFLESSVYKLNPDPLKFPGKHSTTQNYTEITLQNFLKIKILNY